MKFRIFLFLILLSGHCYSQKQAKPKLSEQRTIHNMVVFKWCKDGDTNIKRSIMIDSLGNVIIKGQNFLGKVDMATFTENIHKFIAGEKVEKIPGNNDYRRVAVIPDSDKQSFYVSIILTEDYIKEKNLTNKSYYSWQQTGLEKTQNDYPLFKYLDPDDVKLFQRFLE